jgi:hypothetical protein
VASVGKQGRVIQFIHPQLEREVEGRAGYYVPLEEHILPYDGREVLYILGYACIDNSCCGAEKRWGYVQVPGFLVRKHIHSKESGPLVSEVEIIEEESDRSSIRRSLLQKYPGIQMEMWGAQYGEEVSSHSASGSGGNATQSGGIA